MEALWDRETWDSCPERGKEKQEPELWAPGWGDDHFLGEMVNRTVLEEPHFQGQLKSSYKGIP